jgi:hypothetical protein
VVLRTQNTDFFTCNRAKESVLPTPASPTVDSVPIKDSDHIGRQWSDY